MLKIFVVFSFLKFFEGGLFKVDVGFNVIIVMCNLLFIRCNIIGVFLFEVMWSKDGVLLEIKGLVFVLLFFLIIDFGWYWCIVFNVDGLDVKDIWIDVLGKIYVFWVNIYFKNVININCENVWWI